MIDENKNKEGQKENIPSELQKYLMEKEEFFRGHSETLKELGNYFRIKYLLDAPLQPKNMTLEHLCTREGMKVIIRDILYLGSLTSKVRRNN